MWKRLAFVICILFVMSALHAQGYRWKVGLDYFFDNQEYEKSSFADPQTLHGIWLNTLGGVTWDSTHTIYAGIDLLKIPGMKKAVNKTVVTLYYQYKKPGILLQAGAFG